MFLVNVDQILLRITSAFFGWLLSVYFGNRHGGNGGTLFPSPVGGETDNKMGCFGEISSF